MTHTKVAYDFAAIQKKFNEKWLTLDFWKAQDFSKKPKKYVLIEFPYPSAAGLHMGHCWNYSVMDVYARYHRAKGYNVLYPIGWDAFGLPTYNYAVKVGRDPHEVQAENVQTFKRQVVDLGTSFDWTREVDTSDPQYYKWTQWIFGQLFEHYYDENFKRRDGGVGQARPIADLPIPAEIKAQGKLAVKEYQDKFRLAYKAKMPVSWCPKCKTGLANEEVTPKNTHERCDTPVEQRDLEQWMFRITAYGDRLLEDLEKIDYTSSMKKAQINWIKRSYGVNITYRVKDTAHEVQVFTTRPETNFGATFITCAPDGEFVKKYLQEFPNKEEVEKYVSEALQKTSFERESEGRTKTGVFTGWYAINQLTGFEMPIFIGDFVIGSYGTGALVGVPGHDLRDFEFAQAMGNVKIIRVIDSGDTSEITKIEQVQEDDGIIMNSDFLNGLSIEDARERIMNYLVEKGYGQKTKSYRFRDWVFSRQHYWGEPTPMVYCEQCGWNALPVTELPVKLPKLNDYHMGEDGSSPLERAEDWKQATCPECHGKAVRETDVMPNWAGSNWYYLRYMDPKNNEKLVNPTVAEYWNAVDMYYGGQEHITLHVLYSRFIHKFLYDLGVINYAEPYARRVHHGIILGPDNRKMSKSLGNVVNPDEVVSKYGADVVRMYMMFIGPYDSVTPWSDKAVVGVQRYVERLYNFLLKQQKNAFDGESMLKADLAKIANKVATDIENLKFNTTVAALMEFLNKYEQSSLTKTEIRSLLVVLAPITPYLADEMWEKFGFEGSVHDQLWPEFDLSQFSIEKTEIPVMVNGKLRGKIDVLPNESQDEVVSRINENAEIKKFIETGLKKVIYVPGKAINFVV